MVYSWLDHSITSLSKDFIRNDGTMHWSWVQIGKLVAQRNKASTRSTNIENGEQKSTDIRQSHLWSDLKHIANLPTQQIQQQYVDTSIHVWVNQRSTVAIAATTVTTHSDSTQLRPLAARIHSWRHDKTNWKPCIYAEVSYVYLCICPITLFHPFIIQYIVIIRMYENPNHHMYINEI